MGRGMNTEKLDRDAYRAWWEAEGRADLDTCPCGNPVQDPAGRPRGMLSGSGFCSRHYGYHLTGTDRETFAGWIIAGTFHERDLSEDEARKARRVADGKPYLFDA
jgi:hypothetical protein